MNKAIQVKYKGKKYNIDDYEICSTIWSKFRGLMFRTKNYRKPLLFVFPKPGNYPIHSFFCRNFMALWFLNKKLIDDKIISPYKFSVTPKKKFNFLLEVPLRYFS